VVDLDHVEEWLAELGQAGVTNSHQRGLLQVLISANGTSDPRSIRGP
jgi:hypothetical protein